jgi:hypothetical protein
MAAWRNFVVLFGGFYQTMTHDRWHNDTWVFDARAAGGAGAWTEIAFPATALLPAARSGHGLVIPAGKDLALV